MKKEGNIFKDLYSVVRKELTGILKPRSSESTGISSSDPDYMYDIYIREFSGMKSQNLLNYIDWARRGVPFYFYKYYDAISKRDTRIRTMNRKLKAAILMEQYKITGEWEEGVKFAELVIEHLGGKLMKFFTDAIDANIKGIKRFEIQYDFVTTDSGSYWLPTDISAVPSWMYLYDENTGAYSFLDVSKFDQMKLKTTLSSEIDKIDISKFPQIDVNPLKILDVFAIDGDDKNAFMNGITIALLFAYYLKSYNLKDMNIFLERFASPTIKMKYNGLNPQSKDEMIKASKEWKAHGTVIVPDDSDVDLLSDTQKGQAGNLYLGALSYWNSEITILFSGEEETTQMGEKGSLAAMKVKEKISELILQMNLMTCSSAFNDLLVRLIEINFANFKSQKLPKFEYIKISTLQDKKTQSEINKNLNDVGVRPTLEAMEEQFGVELEEVVSKPAADPEADPPEDPEEDPEENPEEDPEEYELLDRIFFEAEEIAAKEAAV